MAEINPPLYLDQDSAYGAAELGLPWRDVMGEGVVGTNDLLVSASTGLKSSVAAGAAWVKGDDNADTQPTYRVRNDAAVLLQHDAADATNPRIDLVIAQVLDSTFAGVSKLWQLAIVKGTPAATPAAPALPNDAIPLAQVTIPAGSGTLGTITDTRKLAMVGAGAALSHGAELYYGEVNTMGQVISGTEASPTSVNANLLGAALHYDGSPVILEARVYLTVSSPTVGDFACLNWREDGADLGRADYYVVVSTAVVGQAVLQARRKFTPTPGVHTLGVVGWKSGGSTVQMGGGNGGPGGNPSPGYLRITKA